MTRMNTIPAAGSGSERQNAEMDAQAIGNGTSPESCIILENA